MLEGEEEDLSVQGFKKNNEELLEYVRKYSVPDDLSHLIQNNGN